MSSSGRPEDRPANADADHGITWRPWLVDNVHRIDWRAMSTSHALWQYAPQAISWNDADYWPPDKNPTALRNRMAQYYPTCTYKTKEDVEDMGSVGSGGYSRKYNHPPRVDILSPLEGDTFNSNITTTLTADAYDWDGDVAQLVYSCNGAEIGTGTAPDFHVDVVLPDGHCVLTAIATDNDGASAEAPAIAVDVNNSPTLDSPPIADPNPVIMPEQTSTLSVVASDPEGDPLTYSWDVLTGPGLPVFADATADTTEVTFDLEGSYEFEVQVTDDSGGITSGTVTVLIQPEGGVGDPPPADDGDDGCGTSSGSSTLIPIFLLLAFLTMLAISRRNCNPAAHRTSGRESISG